MQLRKLQSKDAPFIVEWMQDSKVNRFFRFNPKAVSLQTVLSFIESAQDTSLHMHLACVNDSDEYLGTISLKNIDTQNKTGEYAISFHPKSQGTGAARWATQEIIRKAFTECMLERVYLDVLEENSHAYHFYEKQGFVYEGTLRNHLIINGEHKSLRLYALLKSEWNQS